MSLLSLAPGIVVEISDPPSAIISASEGRCLRLQYGLSILAAFERPTTTNEAIARLATVVDGREGFGRLMDEISAMHRAGILVHPDGEAGHQQYRWPGLAQPSEQIAMLDDVQRTSSLIRAIESTVQPGDVVVDLGTGTGVLALAAARAGAGKVWAVEMSPMAKLAQQGVEANGMEDVVSVVRAHSRTFWPPEDADVLVSETIGNDPFGEGILATVSDAARRFLRPGGRVIPNSIEPIVVPTAVPSRFIARHMYTLSAARQWRTSYGMDFEWLPESMPDSGWVRVPMSPSFVAKHQSGEAIRMPSISLGADSSVYAADASVAISAETNSFAVAFASFLAPGIEIGSLNHLSGNRPSWGLPVLLPLGKLPRGSIKISMSWRRVGRSKFTVQAL